MFSPGASPPPSPPPPPPPPLHLFILHHLLLLHILFHHHHHRPRHHHHHHRTPLNDLNFRPRAGMSHNPNIYRRPSTGKGRMASAMEREWEVRAMQTIGKGQQWGQRKGRGHKTNRFAAGLNSMKRYVAHYFLPRQKNVSLPVLYEIILKHIEHVNKF